jgi:hypothetical protein
MGWHVTYQTQKQKQQPSGGFAQVVEVGFETDNGAKGSVDVPVSLYSADQVKQRVDAYASELDAVHGLSSG